MFRTSGSSASRMLAEASPTSASVTRRTSAATAPGRTRASELTKTQDVAGRVTGGIVAAARIAQVPPGREHPNLPASRPPQPPALAPRLVVHDDDVVDPVSDQRRDASLERRLCAVGQDDRCGPHGLTLAAGPDDHVRPARTPRGLPWALQVQAFPSRSGGWAMRRRGWDRPDPPGAAGPHRNRHPGGAADRPGRPCTQAALAGRARDSSGLDQGLGTIRAAANILDRTWSSRPPASSSTTR